MSFSIFPRTVYKTKSKISGQIVVKEQLGRYTLYVQEMLQSGGVVKGMWKKAMNRITYHVLPITNVLVLGLGGGTVVGLIKSRWPEAKIVGIEIDPEIVKIGKNFFSLDEIKDLKIVTADAFEFLEKIDYSLFTNHYSLILVDLYLGDKFPPKAASEGFLRNIKKLLAKEGVVVFNWLKNGDDRKLRQGLSAIFSQIEALDLKPNLFLSCHP